MINLRTLLEWPFLEAVRSIEIVVERIRGTIDVAASPRISTVDDKQSGTVIDKRAGIFTYNILMQRFYPKLF